VEEGTELKAGIRLVAWASNMPFPLTPLVQQELVVPFIFAMLKSLTFWPEHGEMPFGCIIPDPLKAHVVATPNLERNTLETWSGEEVSLHFRPFGSGWV